MIITTRRNFLVRATGFVAALAPGAASALAQKPDLPVITPDMVEKIAAWKAAYWKRRDLEPDYLNTPVDALQSGAGHRFSPNRHPYWDADDEYWEAHHAAARLLLAITPTVGT